MSVIQIIAHRGALYDAPEHTKPALKAALKDGADFLGLDILSSKDGIPFLMGQDRLDRTTCMRPIHHFGVQM